MAAEIERQGKVPDHIQEPVGQTTSGLAKQEVGRAKARGGTVAVAADKAAVEHKHAVGHGVLMAFLLSRIKPVETMGIFAAASKVVLNALLPPQCLACNAVVDDAGAVCADCFARMTFVAPPQCDACGAPFETPIPGEVLCGACLAERPVFGRARAVFTYDEGSRGLVLKLKHGDRTDAAVHLARWMHRSGSELLSTCDVILPVPLHRLRLLMRAYNQAALLANALGKLAGKPVAVDALRRIKPTPSQGGLNRTARRRNVGGAFAVKHPARIAGQRVLLIDDVFTTGATGEACTKALCDAGAANVDVLVLARVPAPR